MFQRIIVHIVINVSAKLTIINKLKYDKFTFELDENSVMINNKKVE
nr:hypothetical protein [Mycoplasmopsis bovis]